MANTKKHGLQMLQDIGKIWWFILLAPILFVIFSTVSMFLYPGGDLIDPSTTSYSFFRNYFSDLGRTNVFNGESNFFSLILYLPVLLYVSCAAIVLDYLYYSDLAELYRDDKLKFRLCRYSGIFGIISSLSFIGVALTPADIIEVPHVLLSIIGFAMAIPAYLLLSLVFLQEQRNVRIVGVLLLSTAILLIIFSFISVIIYPVETETDLLITATGQKIVVYIILAIIIVQSLSVMHLIREYSEKLSN